jgi:two-component system, LytTR family, sensor kinase
MPHFLRYWISQCLGWGVFFAICIFLDSLSNQGNTISSVAFDAAFCASGIAVTHFLRKYFYQKKWKGLPLETLLVNVSAAILVSALVMLLFNWVLNILFASYAENQVIQKHYAWFYFISVMILSVWHLIYFTVQFITRNRNLLIERLQMESNVKSLEIKTIKNNLQPHFIFNALNSIRALVDEDPDRARQSITQLSNILRSSIMVNKEETVPLQKELEIVKDYLSLEGVRYEERLQSRYNIAENTMQLPVPPLMLQTLIENAIKHGIAAEKGGGFVELSSFIEKNYHHLSIRNTGMLEESLVLKPNSSGFGLVSTKERLQFIYGSKASLDIKNEDDRVVALHIKIPIEKFQ